jgi:cbb3-type cytochrome oxidase subunit 3
MSELKHVFALRKILFAFSKKKKEKRDDEENIEKKLDE